MRKSFISRPVSFKFQSGNPIQVTWREILISVLPDSVVSYNYNARTMIYALLHRETEMFFLAKRMSCVV
jgi:hypothetical protein